MADNYENALTMKNSPAAQPRSLSNHRPASGGAHRKCRLTPRFQAAKNAPGKIPGRFHKIKNPDFRRNQDFGAAGRIRTADLILTKDALYLLSYSSINGDPERARTVDL